MPCTPVVERSERPSLRPHPLADQVAAGQHVYDAQESEWGRSQHASLAIFWWGIG